MVTGAAQPGHAQAATDHPHRICAGVGTALDEVEHEHDAIGEHDRHAVARAERGQLDRARDLDVADRGRGAAFAADPDATVRGGLEADRGAAQAASGERRAEGAAGAEELGCAA